MELWECPSCYVCPALSRVPASLYADIRSTKEVVTALCLSERSSKQGLVNDDVAEKLDMLQQEVKGLRESAFQRVDQPHPESTTLLTAENFTSIQNSLLHLTEQVTSNLGQLTPDTIPNIEKNLTDLNSKLSGIEHVHSVSQSSSTVTKNSEYPSPNTVSPKAKTSVTPCTSYLDYQKSAISPDTRNSVLEYVKVNESEFKAIGKTSSRDVMYFGEHEYRYSGQSHPAKALPDFANKLLEEVKPLLPAEESTVFNSCLIS